MAQADLSAITFFAPIAAFLIVAVVSYAILATKKILGESKGLNIFIALLIASIFVSAAGARQYVQTVVPWLAVLIVSLAFILMITGFIGKSADFLGKPISIIAAIIAGLIFLVTGFFLFSHLIAPFIPGPGFGAGVDPQAQAALVFLYSPRVIGALVLIIISAIVSYVLVRK